MDIQTALIYFINEGILSSKSPSTLKGYQYSINSLHKYIKEQFIPQDITGLSSEIIGKFFIYGIKIKKWNKYTQWTQYKNLNVFFTWCIKKEFIKSNPLTTLPKPKIPPQQPKALNEKEIIDLLRIVSNIPSKYYFTTIRNKALIATFIYTGLRKSELINLKVKDVDLISDFIVVECGKGGKRREVPIETTILKPILCEYIEYRDRLNKASEWFFNGTFSNRGTHSNKLSESALTRLFNKLSDLSNKRVHAHKLRHSFATLLLDKTSDIYVLKELLGHSDIKTTCIYLSTTRQKKIEAISKFKLEDV